MELPDLFYQIIGEFVISFPKLDNNKQNKAKRDLARNIVGSFPEYIDYIVENIVIPFFPDIKGQLESFDNYYRKNANELIKKHDLEEYRDVIMENYTLSIPKLLNVTDYCYVQTQDIVKACEIYCALGYPGYSNRDCNEDYLINFMREWVEYAEQKGFSAQRAQLALLYVFEDIDCQDEGLIYDMETNKSLVSFFPFSIENVEQLVDHCLKLDYFESAEFKKRVGIDAEIDAEDDFEGSSSSLFFGEDRWRKIKDEHRNSLLCNYYVYIFNKLNDVYPRSTFAICVYSKWLKQNRPTISNYFCELSSSELDSILFDYAIDNYKDITPIRDEEHFFESMSWDDEEFLELLYRLYYQTTISNNELSDLWEYIVVKRILTYRYHQAQETAPILQVAELDYLEDGEINLPWKYVRFVDGSAFFYHPNHEKGENATRPFKLKFEYAKKNLMDLSKTIRWNFPFVKCQVEKGRIISIDESFSEYVIARMSGIYNSLSRGKKFLLSSTPTAKDVLRDYKSEWFSFLERKQLSNFGIIPILENISNVATSREEPALLFTLGFNNETYTLVYEGTCISRASYIFVIERNSYEKAVTIISSYFSSEKINKRSELQFSRDMFKKTDGFLRVIRVLHDNKENWEYTMNFYSK